MMISNKILKGLLISANGVVKTLVRGVAAVFVLAVLGVAGVAVNDHVNSGPDGLAQNTTPDAGATGHEWGSESIGLHMQDNIQLSLIPLANACGLGASSCFKCHNGKRAGVASPLAWHTDHDSVNNSCASCHGGNPRLMKEKMAHTKMLRNPLPDPDNYCLTCHQGSDAAELVANYNSLLGGGE